MKRYRICHMTSAHPPEDTRIFHKECVSLAEAGYEVYLVERGESYEKNGVHIVGVGEIPQSRLKRMTRGARRVYETALALDCDLYHIHDPELLPYALKLKRKGKKVVFDSHEFVSGQIMSKEYIPSALRKGISLMYSSYEKKAVHKLDAVVTVTPSQTDYFKGINFRTYEVRNYPILCRDYCPPSFAKKTVVFAGGLSSQWNHDVVIKAIRHIPDAKYVLCGKENTYLDSLRNSPGWESVDYRGKIPHQDVSQVLSECCVGVALLSPSENTCGSQGTMGNTKIFEEMMAGLPVVCTDFELWREFVNRYHCGICIDPRDVDGVTRALTLLLSDQGLCSQMGQNGRKAVEREFNWQVCSRTLVNLYGTVFEV